jgi:hypothetical protein
MNSRPGSFETFCGKISISCQSLFYRRFSGGGGGSVSIVGGSCPSIMAAADMDLEDLKQATLSKVEHDE